MKKYSLVFSVLLLGFLAAPVFAYKGEALAKHAKVTVDEARAIAVKSYPGTVIDEELKRGKRGLHYCFHIKDDAVTQKVLVDAKTGNILDYKVDGYQGK